MVVILKKSPGEKIFEICNYFIMLLVMLSCAYPFLYILFASFSDPTLLMQQRGILFMPAGFSINSYKEVLKNGMIIVGFRNSLMYVGVGTIICMILTTMGAYALSRKKVFFSTFFVMAIVFTMYFKGGIVPLYTIIRSLTLYNTMWAVILPNAMTTFFLLIMRTFFQSLPDSMEESAKIDGANDFKIFYKIALPLSIPIMAVITLFYGVDNWNSFFYALVFLRDRNLFPLQLVLREILVQNDTRSMLTKVVNSDKYQISQTIKYATIIVVTLPVVLIYPFLQRYFVKGIMIGAIK